MACHVRYTGWLFSDIPFHFVKTFDKLVSTIRISLEIKGVLQSKFSVDQTKFCQILYKQQCVWNKERQKRVHKFKWIINQ